jgi:lysophospholipase L1-like esterase
MDVRKQKNIFGNLIANLTLVVLSFVCIVLISEFIIFRLFLPAADLPRNQFVDGIIKYVPNQKGIFRKFNDYATAYNINADGWNSRHARYIQTKSNKYRIAIIGDSYVEALMVDYHKSLAEQLEDKLGRDKFEVYRFGISGAPLSQYLQTLRKEVVKYSPDFVVIVLVHNDFDESYKFVPGRYTSSFLKIKVKDGKILGEIPPKEYKEGLAEYLVEGSAIFRYFVFNRGVNIDSIRRLVFREPKYSKIYRANIDITNLDLKRLNSEKVTEYLMNQIKKVAIQHKFQLLFMMDGDRYDIYKGNNSANLYNKSVLRLNEMAKKIADADGIPFIDLQPIFQQDYQKNHIKFNYVHEFHWNEYGHQIAAEAIYKYLQERKIAQEQ